MIRPSAHGEWLEVQANRCFANTEGPSDLALAPSFTNHSCDYETATVPSGDPSRSVVALQVVRVSRVEREVSDAVIGSVAVDVVNHLIGDKPPTQVLLHDPAVLHDLPKPAVLPDPPAPVALRGKAYSRHAFRTWSRSAVESRETAWVRAVDGAPSKSMGEGTVTGLASGCHLHSIPAGSRDQ